MSEVSVRRSDGVILQFGFSLGEMTGCDVFPLTSQQETGLRNILSQPHGDIHFSNGSFTFDPPPPPPPPPADQAQFDAAVAKLRSTFGTARSVADVNQCLDAATILLRRLYRELQ